MNENPHKPLSALEGLEKYKNYFVTLNGEIFSTKRKRPKRLKEYWSNGKRSYRVVQITDGTGKKRSFYIHQLVCKAFLPNHSNSWGIRHKDGDRTNNALSNLEWMGRKRIIGGTVELDTERLTLDKELTDYIKLVHLSAIKKGIPVPDTYEFFHNILSESLDEYISRFGLKKTMYQLANSR